MIEILAPLMPSWEWLAGALTAVAAFAGVWIAGRRSGAVAAENRGLRKYQETRRAMDNADTGDDDPAVLRDWLRERGKPGGNL